MVSVGRAIPSISLRAVRLSNGVPAKARFFLVVAKGLH